MENQGRISTAGSVTLSFHQFRFFLKLRGTSLAIYAFALSLALRPVLRESLGLGRIFRQFESKFSPPHARTVSAFSIREIHHIVTLTTRTGAKIPLAKVFSSCQPPMGSPTPQPLANGRDGCDDGELLERRRTASLPNLVDLANEKQNHGSGGASDASSDVFLEAGMAIHVSHDTFLEATRSMERLQVELERERAARENREQVIHELVALRAKDKTEYEAQICCVQSELMAERAKTRAIMARYEQSVQRQPRPSSMISSMAGVGGTNRRVVTGGTTVLNANAWNNIEQPMHGIDATILLDDFMI